MTRFRQFFYIIYIFENKLVFFFLQIIVFRYINEMIYTQTSEQSAKMFKKDPLLFEAYHQVNNRIH